MGVGEVWSVLCVRGCAWSVGRRKIWREKRYGLAGGKDMAGKDTRNDFLAWPARKVGGKKDTA